MQTDHNRDQKAGARPRDLALVDPEFLRALTMISAHAEDWTKLLQELIRIPSCFEAEHEIVHRVCEYVTAIGLVPTADHDLTRRITSGIVEDRKSDDFESKRTRAP